MKQNWSLFVAGMFLILTIAIFMPKTQAETDSTKSSETPSSVENGSLLPKKIDDTSISGIKTEVPSSADLESSLQKREKELAEKDLRMKEAGERLAAEEARMKIKISEYEKLQADMNALENKAKQTDEAILARLVKTFETMSPKKAAVVLATLSDDVAVELCLKLKEKKLASIMDVMDPVRATQLSTLVYNRRPAEAVRGVASERSAQGAGLAPKK